MRCNLSRLLVLPAVLLATFSQAATAQSAQAVAASARIVQTVDVNTTTALTRTLPDWANAANERGDLAGGFRIEGAHLILARSPQVEAAFQQLLLDQQDPASPRYHQWLTPQQNADQYGIAPADLAAVKTWLTSSGLSVDDVAAGGVFVTFSGPVSAVQTAFRTSLRNFNVDGATRFAPAFEPSVPTALLPLVKNVSGLTQYVHTVHSHARALPQPMQPNASNGVQPDITFTSGTHAVTPGDFNTIYDVPSATTGTGIHVANIINSRVATVDYTGFNSFFNLTAARPTEILIPSTGADPGIAASGSEGEATLDAQRILGTAPGAIVDLLVIGSLQDTYIQTALQYNISTQNDPVVNMSFGSCDTNSPPSRAQGFDTYYQTSAAQGISIFVSSGDSAAAGCAQSFSTPTTTTPVLGINVLCSSGYLTCVGGTQFNDTASPATYWSASNATNKSSALGYIPEGAWNEPSYVSNGVTNYQIAGTGGGISRFAKPSWQVGTGVPADGLRDTPDISFTASGHDGYLVCQADGSGNTASGNDCTAGSFHFLTEGTSASSPSMAGVAALLVQKTGTRQGNINPLLYRLYANAATNLAFNDATPTSSGVTTCSTGTASICNNSTPSNTGLTGGLAGYGVTVGYDLSTGLGSLDVAKFLTAAVTPYIATTLTLAAAPNPIAAGQSTTLTATMTPASFGTLGTGVTIAPTGTVQFYSNTVAIGAPVTIAPGTAANTFTASLTQPFPTAGTYAITAVYSGDTTYKSSNQGVGTGAALNLTVTSTNGFTITPTPTALTLISGATTGNTSSIAVTSTGTFAGTVALTCTVTNTSGTAAGSCILSPNAVTLTAGSTSNSTLTINTTAGTRGSLSVTVTGVNGSITTTSTPVNVTVNAAGLTATAAPSTLTLISGATTGNTSVVTVTSTNGFAGTVNITCATTGTTGTAAGTCTPSSPTVTLTAGGSANATITVTTTPGTAGTLTQTVTATGTTTGATLSTSATATITSTLTASNFTVATPPPATISVNSGATTGNTSSITITPISGFTGTVTLTCATGSFTGSVTAANSGCTVLPSTVTLAGGVAVNATVTLASTYGSGGSLVETISATGTTTGATLAYNTTLAIGATIVGPALGFSTVPALNFTSGAVTGNTATLTLTGSNNFAGPVTLACSISVSSAANQPTCMLNPTSLTLTNNGSATTVATITTVAAHAKQTELAGRTGAGRFGLATGGATLALLLCLVPFRRNRRIGSLMALLALFAGLSAIAGCGGGGTAPKVLSSSAGTYVVTVTATGTPAAGYTTTGTTTFNLTVN